MKKIIPILLIAFAPLFSQGQAYTPLNLDTSSFWIHDFYQYQGQLPGWTTCEMFSYVQKDTLIGGNAYSKVVTYLSKLYHNSLFFAEPFFKRVNFIREDTLARKVFIYDSVSSSDLLYIDFNLSINDTVDSYPFPAMWSPNNPIVVDSVLVKNIMGVNRKVTYYNHPGINHPINEEIEGVGMRFQFPFNFGGGEWGAPGLTCRCYSKGQTVQYLGKGLQTPGVYSIDSCFKKKAFVWPVSTNDIKLENVITTIYKNRVVINNANGVPLTIRLINTQGAVIFSTKSDESSIDFELNDQPAGIYILSLQSSKGIENRKILIR